MPPIAVLLIAASASSGSRGSGCTATSSACGYGSIRPGSRGLAEAQPQVDAHRNAGVPNLVATVRGYAVHERVSLQAVVGAWARAIAITDRRHGAMVRLRHAGAVWPSPRRGGTT